jgi:protein O-mannosyl-transferase
MLCLAIAAAAIAVYANSQRGPFLLDDHRSIVTNESIRQLYPISAVLRPPRQIPQTTRPLVNLSFALNYAAGGFAVEGYHAVNLALHVLAGLALFGVLSRTFTRTSFLGEGLPARSLAFFCTVAWVVHPLNSEAVNYLTQRSELMMGWFYLLALYASIRALEMPRRARWPWLACVSAFCAVASKETALTLPFVVVLWDRVFSFSSWREAWRRRWRLYVGVAASWLLYAFLVRDAAFFAADGFPVQVSRWTYLLNQASVIEGYLKRALWPTALIFDYGNVPATSLGAEWPSVVGILILLAAAVLALVRVPQLGFWGAWFFITLAPASSIIPIPTEVGADRRMYLPLLAVIVLVVSGCHVLLKRVVTPSAGRKAAVAAGSVALLVLSVLTVRRNTDYQSGLAIWQSVVDRRPHSRAHEHLALSLRDAGRIDESIAHLRTAAPDSAEARHALASALLERGEIEESIKHFREFVTRYPDNRDIVRGREEMAGALIRAGDAQGAVDQFRAIVERFPTYARGYAALGDALVQTGDVDGATRAYREALRVRPDYVLALVSLGSLLADRGERDEALTISRRALEIEPRALPPRRIIVRLLLEMGQMAESEKEAQALVALAPNDPEARNLLGIVLASQKQFDAARKAFEEAVRLDPSHRVARANLARLQGQAAAPLPARASER